MKMQQILRKHEEILLRKGLTCVTLFTGLTIQIPLRGGE